MRWAHVVITEDLIYTNVQNDQVETWMAGQINITYSRKKWSDIKLLVETFRRHGRQMVNPIQFSSQ